MTAHANRPLGLDELLLLNHLWLNRRLTTAEGARLIQKSETDARSRLERLVEAGLVEGRGERKGRIWHLSAATYRRLGEEAAYVRQRGFEPIQQEQMILQYVDNHRKITRMEAAELCRLSRPQAYRMSQSLVKKELLIQSGTRGRNVHYERKKR